MGAERQEALKDGMVRQRKDKVRRRVSHEKTKKK